MSEQNLDEVQAALGYAEGTYPTKRPTNPYMEEIMGHRFGVLDHGFLELRDYMGDQGAILDAARNSYQGGTKSFRDDRGLLRYLMRKRHTTPFEMAEVKFHAKLPIFVARQWVRHRMASINEESARYSVLSKEFYNPELEDLAPQSSANRQGRAGEMTYDQACAVRALLFEDAERSYAHYAMLLGDRDSDDWKSAFTLQAQDTDDKIRHELLSPEYPGLARELARMGLSLNFYTSWTWKTDVKNFMDFISLRNDPHAQLEIQRYADRMESILGMWMPQVYEAFLDYRRNAVMLSGPAIEVLRQMISSDTCLSGPTFRHELGKVLEKRELQETMEALGLPFE